MSTIRVLTTIAAFRAAHRDRAGSLGLVPTMGYLHEGHLDLVRRAKAENDHVAVTIFVNPTQFAANEDFGTYPRDPERDLALLEQAGVDLVFMPLVAEMYPGGFQTYVEVTEVSTGLEGERRPGHFRGVATVVCKLFNITQPNRAYFGQKDAQQVAVIRRMVMDLALPISLIIVPTRRDTDGLALSSRNTYLDPAQRAAAPVLFRALVAASARYHAGERDPNHLRQVMVEILHAEPLAQIDYVSVADSESLRELEAPAIAPILLSLAVRFGRTRLIDNMVLA